MQTLLDGTPGNIIGDPVPFTGGMAKVNMWGTFDGATAFIQVQTSDGTWINADGGDFTGGLSRSLNLPPTQIRAISTGGTAPVIKAEIAGI